MENFYDGKRVLVTGGHGFLGKHLVRKLREKTALVTAPHREDLDLTHPSCVVDFIAKHRSLRLGSGFDLVFHLAAHVGGIHYNTLHPYELIEDNCNMAFAAVTIANAFNAVLVGAGSVCAYPKYVPVPAIEENLYKGYPEESNGAYGNAKRILLEAQKAAWDQYGLRSIHIVSANLYGPGDNFDPAQSHVIPSLILKVQECIDEGSDHINVWGTGEASRDFLYVEDAADAYLIAGEHASRVPGRPEPLNIASNSEVRIAWLAKKICEIMGYDGEIVYDATKPDGQKRRAFRIERYRHYTGWEPTTPLDVGLERTVKYFRKHIYQKGI